MSWRSWVQLLRIPIGMPSDGSSYKYLKIWVTHATHLRTNLTEGVWETGTFRAPPIFFSIKVKINIWDEKISRQKRTLFLFPSKDDIYCSPSRSWNFGLKICVRSTVVSGVVFCYILKDIYVRFKSWVFFLLNETRYSLRNKMRNDYHDESNIRDGF